MAASAWKPGSEASGSHRKEEERRSLFWAGNLPIGLKSLGSFSWISIGTQSLKILQGSVILNDRSCLTKGVTRHAKFILKSKNVFSKNPGLG